MKIATRAGVLLLGLQALPARAALPTVAAAPAAPPSTAASLLQAGFGLLAVLALVFACAWVARRLGVPGTGSGNRVVKVVASAAVGQRERVVVVEIGGEWLVLGVAAGAVRHLRTQPAGMPAGSGDEVHAGAPGAAFGQQLRASLAQINGRT